MLHFQSHILGNHITNLETNTPLGIRSHFYLLYLIHQLCHAFIDIGVVKVVKLVPLLQ